MEDLEIFRKSVLSAGAAAEHTRIVCPSCSEGRKKKNQRTLSVTADAGSILFKCHHCAASGCFKPEEVNALADRSPLVNGSARPHPKGETLGEAQLKYLADRGIGYQTVIECGLVSGDVWIRDRGSSVSCIGFPYTNSDSTTAIKWRDGAKNFTQSGVAQSLWRIDEFTGGDLVICEGELDVCSFQEVGIFSTSVPNGAPAGEVKDEKSKKFSYLWDAKEVIEKADRIILATDRDIPGNALAEEIARRVGKARCWRVPFPEGCKDANDTLVKCGKDALVSALSAATPWPVHGLRDASEYRDDAIALYSGGMDRGIGSGIYDLDRIYKVQPQTLTIVTGVPGSGKSAFLTWLSVNLATRHKWSCAVLSAETSSQVHILQIAAAYMDKPFRGIHRMSEEELNIALDWVEGRFVFLDESDTDIQSVLDRAHAAVLRNGVNALLVDPYNFLTGAGEDAFQGINKLLVNLKSFSVEHGIAVWLVAHPKKMYRQHDGKVPVPGGYDVSGSASFYNVADSGITISRASPGKSLVTCWKSRFPWIGMPGEALLDFDPGTGVFSQTTFGEEESDGEGITFD